MSHAPSLSCTDAKVRQLMRRLSQHYDGEVAACGLKNSQYSLLTNAARSGPVRSVDLAAVLKMTASTLSRNLKPLIAAGFVTLQEGDDARSHLVVVTDAGQVKINEARTLWRLAQRNLESRVGVDRLRDLHELIDETMNVLSETPGAVVASSGTPAKARARPHPKTITNRP